MPSHFLKLRDISPETLENLLRLAVKIKAEPDSVRAAADRKGLLLLFEKTSTRTSLSFQSAIARMGGYSVVMDWRQSNFPITAIEFETQYISRNCDVIMARLRSHASLRRLAAASQVPVINGCDDRYHPTQALADFLTILEVSGRFDGTTLCYVGVHNNVTNCLIEGCVALGVRLLLVTPLTNPDALDPELESLAAASGLVERRPELASAAREADYVYTDTWVDMEHFDAPEYADEQRKRIETMRPFQVNRDNLGGADPYLMHDMPIHPGYEIATDLVESERSVIYRQAENRMYAEQALLLHLLAR